MNRHSGKLAVTLGLLGSMLAACIAKAWLPSHTIFADVVGDAYITFDSSVPTWKNFSTNGKVSGFANDAFIQVSLSNISYGPANGFLNLYRRVGGEGKRGNGGKSEQLLGDLTGVSVDVGTGVAFVGTATVVSGTGRLAGATGSIYVAAYHDGYLDPTVTGPQALAEITLDGEYTTP